MSSSSSSSLATRRAKQRWSALVSAPTSRLAGYMRDTLGPVLWADFVRHANQNYKAAYVQAFNQPTLRCVGRTDGTPCPHTFEVDMFDPQASSTLQSLHLDHKHPVHLTCRSWIESLPMEPRSWDDGIDQNMLCHSLFGVSNHPLLGPPCLHFRCGPRRCESGFVARYAHQTYSCTATHQSS